MNSSHTYEIHRSTTDPQLLVNLWRQTFLDAYFKVHSTQNILTYFEANFTPEKAQAAIENQQTSIQIAYCDDQPVGLLVMNEEVNPVTNLLSIELKQLYILASEYGKGLGKLLLDCAKKAATDQEKELWLCVSDWNIRAQKFYRKNGFVAAGKGPKLIVGSDHIPSSIMTLNLKT